MNLKETMLIWTPNRGEWAGRSTAGQVVATTIPEDSSLKAHPMSAGACDLSWKETDDDGRRRLLQRYFTQMVHRDGIAVDVVRTALSKIVDINPLHLSDAKPDANDASWQWDVCDLRSAALGLE
jgi:hypothetical protein